MANDDEDSGADSHVRIVHNVSGHQFEAWIGDDRAGIITYALAGSTITYEHTVVPNRFGGRGVASQLAFAALTDARRESLQVVPQCPFIARYIDKHPEFADLLASN